MSLQVSPQSRSGLRPRVTDSLCSLLIILRDQRTMAREEWETVTDNGVKEAAGDIKNTGGKTVRFVAGASETQCDNRSAKTRDSGAHSPQLNMVQSLVPHLPGLEKDKVYVISGICDDWNTLFRGQLLRHFRKLKRNILNVAY